MNRIITFLACLCFMSGCAVDSYKDWYLLMDQFDLAALGTGATAIRTCDPFENGQFLCRATGKTEITVFFKQKNPETLQCEYKMVHLDTDLEKWRAPYINDKVANSSIIRFHERGPACDLTSDNYFTD